MDHHHPARQSTAADLVISFQGHEVVWSAADGELLIGRENPPAHVKIAHPAISRLHVRVIPGSPWRLVDYDSRNGVYLDGQRVSDLHITDGMTVHLGHPDGVAVTFHYVSEPTTLPVPVSPVSVDALALVGTDRVADPDEDTETLSDELRRALLNEAIVVSFDSIAAGLAELPAAGSTGLRARLNRVDGLLGALSALGAEDAAAAFGTVRGVYGRLIDQAAGGLAA